MTYLAGTVEDMKRLGLVLATLVLALGGVAVASPKAYAASAPITRMAVTASVATDGTITVAEEFDMDFTTAGHGPYLYFTTRQGSGQTNQYRIYDYHFVSVTSSTGAPSAFITDTSQYGTTALRIGDANRTVTGTRSPTHSRALSTRTSARATPTSCTGTSSAPASRSRSATSR